MGSESIVQATWLRPPILRGDSRLNRPAQFVRPVALVADGASVLGAEFLQPPHSSVFEDAEVATGLALIDKAAADGVQLLYAAPSGPSCAAILERLGFERRFDVQRRNLYLGVGSVSKVLDHSLDPVRNFARYATRLRQKLMEVEWSDGWLGQASSLFNRRRAHLDFAVDRSVDYLRDRYARIGKDYRLLVLRRKAGVGIDAFVVVRIHRYKGERRCLELVDHWTRERDRRSMAWLIGELVMWGLAEKCDLVQAFAAAGSPLDQTLIAAGCLRKTDSAPFMTRQLDPALRVTVDAERTQLRAGDLAHY